MLTLPPGETDPLKVAAQDMKVFIIDLGCAAMASGFSREVSVAYCMPNSPVRLDASSCGCKRFLSSRPPRL